MLSKSMDEKDVTDLLKECGPIEECTVLREEGRSKGKFKIFMFFLYYYL